MSLFGDVASALTGGLSQPRDFGGFVAQQAASRATGAVMSAITPAVSRLGAIPGVGVLGQLGLPTPGSILNNGVRAVMNGVAQGNLNPADLIGQALSSLGGGQMGSGPMNPYGTLAKMQRRSDPLLSIDWTATIIDGASSPIEDIYIEGVQTPSLRFDNKPVYRQGTTVNYAAGLSIDNANLVLYNDRTGKALKFASSWFNAVFNFKTRNFRMPIEYKKDVLVFLLDVNGNVICRIDLVGCFPVSLNSTNLEATGSNLIPVTLDLSVDHCYFSGT